jgi:hypothetical protein
MLRVRGSQRPGRATAVAALFILLTGSTAPAQDIFTQRFWAPLPPSSAFTGPLPHGTASFVDGWSAFATGYHIRGHSRTHNVLADGGFTSHGYIVGLAKRLTPNITIGGRVQRGDSDVDYDQLAGRTRSLTSHGFAIDLVVEDQHVVWRTTGSFARNSYDAQFDPATPASWNGHEWAFDSQFNLRWTFSRVVASTFAGFRYLSLEQNAFTTVDAFGFISDNPSQHRISSQLRLGGDVLWSIVRAGPFELLASANGQVRYESFRHPPIAAAADLTGMAGNSFTFDYPDAEPARFPSSVTWLASAGLELRAADTVHLFVHGTTHQNPQLHWHAVQAGARLLF